MLNGKVAIITGGGSGLGEAGCKLLAQHGAKVVVADTNIDEAIRVVDEIRGNDWEAMAILVDVANKESVSSMVDITRKIYGKIDILINNAGITRDSKFTDMTDKQWDEVIATNLTGVFNCTHAVVPHMIKQGYGRIINTSSVVGTSGNIGQANYAAAKAGVIGFTKALAKELGRYNITVNAVAPGFIDTPMVANVPEKVLDKVKLLVPSRQLGKPYDIAKAYLDIATNDYMNGTVVEVDGGIQF